MDGEAETYDGHLGSVLGPRRLTAHALAGDLMERRSLWRGVIGVFSLSGFGSEVGQGWRFQTL